MGPSGRQIDLTQTPPNASSSGDSAPRSLADTEASLQQQIKEGTSLDTVVARLVVEQGLATSDEVEAAMSHVRANPNDASLVQLLVKQDLVTVRQIERLRQVIEAERSGQSIPGYRLINKLGAGAMASVFKAKQLSLDRHVAIKILPKKFSSNPQFIERFYAEGRSAASLNHPNIVQAYDVARAGEYHYFVMEFVDGRTVFDDIEKNRRFTEKDAIQIAIQSAEALEHAHGRGLIHRDIKPKNIMITHAGVVKVADLGLARAMSDKDMAEAEAGKAFGTPYYISPEQIRGEKDIGPPADIYSLGATLYHMVTGSVPFEGRNPSSVMHKHLKSPLVPPDHVNPKLGAGISQVIEMMMAKDSTKRYRNCTDLLIDLRAIAKGEPPVIAAQDLRALDLASIAKAEAEAPVELREQAIGAGDQSKTGLIATLIAVGCVALISIAINIIQAMS